MDKISILIVDDDKYILNIFSRLLTEKAYTALTAVNGKKALQILARKEIDIVITDVKMPEMDGIQLLREIKDKYPAIDVVMISGYGSINDAVKSMKQGATDYILKPFSLDEVLLKIENICKRKKKHISKKEMKDVTPFPNIIAESKTMKEILEEVNIVSPTNATVLIIGDTGVGKDVIARLIHAKSKRSNKPFIRMNCVELNEGIIESELFGHEKGSFTGAVSQKKGRLELADTGTIFLDEIGDIPLSTQKKLLRILEQKEFERVGGTETISIDVRVIAATNKALPYVVKKKKFRKDLYYRLNTVMIKMYPLHERKEDIIPLAEYFLERFAGGERKLILTRAVKDMLVSYSWPGNVRELKSTIERAVIFAKGEDINLQKLFGEKDSIDEVDGTFTIECPT
ncbi:MAG: sigma-54-dependent Fis family transcriptional regulator, partial [Candidatus Cloacimonadota bacterium]